MPRIVVQLFSAKLPAQFQGVFLGFDSGHYFLIEEDLIIGHRSLEVSYFSVHIAWTIPPRADDILVSEPQQQKNAHELKLQLKIYESNQQNVVFSVNIVHELEQFTRANF